jgi:cellulose synthase/poly-beta-1,6-N-acetylglucosamine synthase-like glycosyltransferase
MGSFLIPGWLKQHLFSYEKVSDISSEKLDRIKNGLSRLNSPTPDVSIVIPVWNEENNILRTLSSLSEIKTDYQCELILVNNNSTDNTQGLIDSLGVRSVFEKEQGIANARTAGLMAAKGKYHLCADADTFYPTGWVDAMVKVLKEEGVVCIYGKYSFIPPDNSGRFGLALYESVAELLFHLRKKGHEYINVLGFNFGFITDLGRNIDGFRMDNARKGENLEGSKDYVAASEDGMMAMRLMELGKIKRVTSEKARAWTGTRRLLKDGSLGNAFKKRVKTQGGRFFEYLKGRK